MPQRQIAVVDCGGQTAHLVTSCLRAQGYAAGLVIANTPAGVLADAAGIIISGGPRSVYEVDHPQPDPGLLTLGVPVLGLCYGHQWIAQQAGGTVERGAAGEYGPALVWIDKHCGHLLADLGPTLDVWMSHGDTVTAVPPGFRMTAYSHGCDIAAMLDEKQQICSLQFHPEVSHTVNGDTILRRFAEICGADPWSLDEYLKEVEGNIKRQVGQERVLMLVSGGVDSTVAFVWLNNLLGNDAVRGVFIDTGLLRRGEREKTLATFQELGFDNVTVVDASDRFFAALCGVYDPKGKRLAISDLYVLIALEQMIVWRCRMLAQGTLYPDKIESGMTTHADQIKLHHNLGPGLKPLREEGLIVEPVAGLYKNEVRFLGARLGIPTPMLARQPFPGPGLAVRCICGNYAGECGIATVSEILMPNQILPVQSVGVKGDARTYERALVIYSEQKCVIPDKHWDLARTVTNRMSGINRVVVCLSHIDSRRLFLTPTDVTREQVQLDQEADAAVHRILDSGLWQKIAESIWQFPVVLLPVGLQPGGQSIVLRPVESVNAMTARATRLPTDLLQSLTSAILAIPGIEVVFYDLTSKPPGTIEWE